MALLFNAASGTGASAKSVYAVAHTPSDNWWVTARGGFSGKSLEIQISQDGTNWAPLVTDFQSGGTAVIAMSDALLRAYIGAAGSGSVTVEVWIAGAGQLVEV